MNNRMKSARIQLEGIKDAALNINSCDDMAEEALSSISHSREEFNMLASRLAFCRKEMMKLTFSIKKAVKELEKKIG